MKKFNPKMSLVLFTLALAGILAMPAFAAQGAPSLNDQLVNAVAQGDLPTVTSLVKQGADVNAVATLTKCFMQDGTQVQCSVQSTPLLVATGRGNLQIAQYLVGQGADPTIGLPEGFYVRDPVTVAHNYQYDHQNDQAGAAAAQQKTQAFMSLYIPAAAQQLIRKKSVDHLFLDNSESVLALAAESGDTDTARLLIANGADVNLKQVLTSDRGLTPLMEAAFGRQDGLIQILVDAGADVNLATRNGNTALGYTAYKADPVGTELLLDRGANPNVSGMDGDVPLSSVVVSDKILSGDDLSKRIEVIRILVAHKAAIDYQDPRTGMTALMTSIWAPNPDIVEALLDAGANPNLTSKEGTTAMGIAENYINDPASGTTPQMKPLYQKIIDELKAHGATK